MNKFLSTLVAGAMLGVIAGAAQAASVTFGQVLEGPADGNDYVYTASAPPGTSTLSVTNTDVRFTFFSQAGLFPTLLPYNNSPIDATLNLTGTATTGYDAFGTGGNNFDTLSFSIVANSGPLAGKTLLAGTAGSSTPGGAPIAGTLFATTNNQAGTLSGSNNVPGASYTVPYFVKFTSQVIDLSSVTDQNYAFGLSSVLDTGSNTGGFTYTNVGPFARYLNSFTAAGVGTFAATPNVPEPGTLALLAGGAVSLSMLRRRRK
jgi:hypothetical protein